MARRNSTKATESETPDEATEGTEADTSTETPAEASTEAPAETPAEEEIDLTAFQAAVTEAVSNRDDSDGSITAANAEAITAAYRELSGQKPKNAAKSWNEEQMIDAIMDERPLDARAYVAVKNVLNAATKGGGGGTSTPRQPADPTKNWVNKVAGLRLALTLVPTPENLAENAQQQVADLLVELESQVEAYIAWQDSDDEDAEEPEVSPVVKAAYRNSRVSQRGSGGGGSRREPGAPRRDVMKHIISAAEASGGGFLSVAQIVNHDSEEYGDDHPSAGAVSARLFNGKNGEVKGLPENITLVTDEKPRGIRVG